MSKVAGEVVYPDVSTGTFLKDDGTFDTPASGGAPTDATYVTISANATLSDERTLAGTTGEIDITDNGAGGSVQVGLVADVVIPTTVTVPNTGLHVLDTDASHDLILKPGSDLTADHTLTLTTGDADRTLTLTGNASITGTNTGDQTITLSSDVTGSGTGAITTTIANDAVTYAKMQDVSAASRVLGRGSAAGSGDVEEMTVGSGLALTGTVLSATGGGAPSNATYVTVSLDGTLSDERTLAGTAGEIDLTDGGAGGTIAVGLVSDVVIPTTVTVPNTGLHLLDTDASHDLIIKPGSDLAADRILTITTGDAARTLTLTGDASITGTNTGDQTITLTGHVTGSGTGSFATTIASDVVAVSMLADGTDGELITWDASGEATTVAVGTSGHVLVSNGAGAAPTFQARGRRPSFDNPRASPHSYDDEFDATTLDAKWTVGGTQTPTTGTIAPTSTLSSVSVYDLNSWPSWLLMQGHNASTKTGIFTQAVTLDTNATLFFKVMQSQRGFTSGAAHFGSAGEGNLVIRFSSSVDSNEFIQLRLDTGAGTGTFVAARVQNNGVNTDITGAVADVGNVVGSYYGALFKSTNDYHFYLVYPGGGHSYLGSLTKTGVTTFDQAEIVFSTSDDTTSPILGVDFIRYYPSITWALVNP